MTLPAIPMRGVRYQPPDAGAVGIPADADVTSSGGVRIDDDGVAFGPLKLSQPGFSEQDVVIDELHLPLPGTYGLLPLAVAAGAGMVAADEETRDKLWGHVPAVDGEITRRQALRGGAALGALATTAGGASAHEDHENRELIEGHIRHNPSGIRVQILDRTGQVLDPPAEMQVVVDGTERDQWQAPRGFGSIPQHVTGDFSVATEDQDSLVAWARGLVADDTHRWELSLPQKASRYADGETVVISDDSVVVDVVERANDDRTVIEIGEASIPHRGERAGHARGSWRIDPNQRALVYEAGERAPTSEAVVVKTRIGRASEAWDDVSRRIGAVKTALRY